MARGGDFVVGDTATSFFQRFKSFCEGFSDDFSAVFPFVDELFEDAGIGVLRDERVAEEFETEVGDFFDEAWIVHKPPTSENFEIGEFPGDNAEVLGVFAREGCDDKCDFGVIAAKGFEAVEVGGADAISGLSESRVDLAIGADHESEGEIVLFTGGKNDFVEDFGARILPGILEIVGEGDGHVSGMHLVDARCDEVGGICKRVRISGDLSLGYFEIVDEGVDAEDR